MGTYQDFSIQIGPPRGEIYPVSVIKSPAGTGHGHYRLPCAPEHLGALLTALDHTVRGTEPSRDIHGALPPVVPQDVGTTLFNSLFTGEIKTLFDQSLGRVEAQKQVLRVKLHLNVSDPTVAPLASLPWELLYRHERRTYLVQSPHTTVVRYLDVQWSDAELTFEPPLRILFIMANPKRDLALEKERKGIEAKLRSKNRAIKADFLDDATYGDLERCLHERDYHILHFMGHGDFDGNEGVLLLMDGPVKGRDLGALLLRESETRLVLLNACRTAQLTRRPGQDSFAGVASAVVMAGVPAVVAMQFPISDPAAIAFSERFYSELARGRPVEHAVDAGRNSAKGAVRDRDEWATPVAFLRRDGDLFPVRRSVAAKAALAMVVALITMVAALTSELIVVQPWTVLGAAIPLVGLAGLAWRWWKARKDRRDLLVQPSFAVFLGIYLMVFAAVTASDLVSWKRTLVGLEREVPRTLRLPAGLLDWPHKLVPKAPRTDLLLVTIGNYSPGVATRYHLANIISVAKESGALGVALDLYFEDSSATDSLLCAAVDASGIPILSGYTLRFSPNHEPTRVLYPETLRSCLPDSKQGHLVGYQESDQRVRSIPLSFLGKSTRPALSLRVARKMAEIAGGELKEPRTALLQFVAPAKSFPVVNWNVGGQPDADRFDGMFLLVGRYNAADSVATPYGRIPGLLVHAYAIQSLLTGHYLRRAPWWVGALVLLLCCYSMTLLADRGGSPRTLIVSALGLSVGVAGVAAVSVYLWFVRVDVVYAFLGMWLLIPLLLAARRWLEGLRTAPSRRAARGSAGDRLL